MPSCTDRDEDRLVDISDPGRHLFDFATDFQEGKREDAETETGRVDPTRDGDDVLVDQALDARPDGGLRQPDERRKRRVGRPSVGDQRRDQRTVDIVQLNPLRGRDHSGAPPPTTVSPR